MFRLGIISQSLLKFNKKLKFIFFAFLVFCAEVMAQDPQLTQFYAAPVYLNPAFAGATPCWRLGANHRNQWFLSNRAYATYMVSVDKNIRSIGAGLGGYILHDTPGAGGYNTFEFAVAFAKQIKINKDLQFRIGLQPSYHLKYLTATNNIYGTQLNNLQGFVGGPGDAPQVASYNFFDLSTGFLLYSRSFWIGLGVHHLLRNPLMTSYLTEYVPMKVSLHGGKKIELFDDAGSTITPAFQLKNQGTAFQLDLGVYFERNHLVLGTWYRGIPFITGKGLNSDALAFLIGYKKYDFRLCYSYDLPLSRMINSFGTHEISLVFEFCKGGKEKPPRNIQQLPCPVF